MRVYKSRPALLASAAFALCSLMAVGPAAEGQASGSRTSERTSPGALVGTVEGQSYRDGPDGTVFTLTEITTPDGQTLTVSTRGGIRSDGMGQYTSHEAEFTVGNTYRLDLIAVTDTAMSGTESVDAGTTVYRVRGGDDGMVRVTEDGELVIEEANDSPTNFALTPYNWAWTLPENPPIFQINPNTSDLDDEIALVQAAFDAWKTDPGSAADWAYGGTTTVAKAGYDGTNAVFWADTPDPADRFLAQATTFYDPSTGNALSSDIMFNNDVTWVDGAVAGGIDIVSVATHEAGHSFGLGHAPDGAAIMYFSISSNLTKRILSIGDRGGITAHYPKAAATVGQSVDGSVGFSDGAAASDISVDLFTENRVTYLESTTTDVSGDFGFELAEAGCYVATFIAPEGVTFVGTGNGFQNSSFCAEPNEAVTGLRAVLVAPGTATTSIGQVTFTDGLPAAGVQLDLFTDNRAAYINSTDTGEDGSYTLNLLGTGCYVTTFIAPSGTTFADSGNGFLDRSFCATEGEAVTGIDAVLVGAAAQATVGGLITGPDAAPEAGAQASVYRAAGDGSRGRWLGDAISGPEGDWSFTAEAGCFVVDLVAPEGRTWASSGSQYQQLSTCVSASKADNTLNGQLS